MSKKSVTLLFCALVAFCGLSTPLFAHQQKAAITTISLNENTNSLEIIHRFSLHDAEHAVKRVLYKKADIYSSEETQTKFADYVFKHFVIERKDGTVVQLNPIGYEIDGRHFWVYQEITSPKSGEWVMQHSALQEIWPSQVNTVNVEVDSTVKTLVFSSENTHQNVQITIE